MKQNILPVLDPGHGGIDPDTGEYVTPGKRFDHGNGEVFYEGEWNRDILRRVVKKLKILGIKYEFTTRDYFDMSLSRRCEIANKYYADNKNAVLFSLHGNAGGGTGYEIYTSPGQTRSDEVATIMYSAAKAWFEPYKAKMLRDFNVNLAFRKDFSDGDPDKESRFTVLTDTYGPAVLIENFFYDRYEDYKFMTSNWGQDLIADSIVAGILALNNSPSVWA